ncbi:hypothetical protein SEUCBS139899_008226 [Sporothrix eucalyptigena]|uniref:Glutathione S-transferase n=1 Tax=Sporothrix eucalyptigena TaxID=1812306 RepID=A0ABP0CE59_9PEZI
MGPELTLYHATHACSTVVQCLLEDVGLPFRVVHMRMGPRGIESVDGSLNREQYLEIHPFGYVPCLVTDGLVITEMPAILTYIANLVPEKKLLGDNIVEQSWALSWAAWLSGALHGRGFGALFRPERYLDNPTMHQAIRAKGFEFIKECYGIIEERLQGKTFPIGEHETIVDFNLLIFYFWGLEQSIDMAGEYPNYHKLFTRMSEKLSVSKVDKFARPALVYHPDEKE